MYIDIFMKLDDVLDDPKVIKFIDDRELSNGSIRNLGTALNKYCGLHNMTPTELINEARKDQKEFEYMDDRRVENMLFKFRKLLKEENASSTYARTLMQLVKGFYIKYSIVLPKIPMKKSFPVHRKKEDEIPNKEEILKAIKVANPQMKAIILLKQSSGMDSVTLRHLTYGQFFDALNEELNALMKPIHDPFDFDKMGEIVKKDDIILNWTLERSKVGFYKHYTCCTPEATRAIVDYLILKPPKSFDSPLFRTRGRPDDIIEGDTLIVNFRTINNKCGFGKVGRYGKFHAHALRAHFATTLLRYNIRKEYADFMMGHIVDETSSSYFVPTKEGVREQYEKVSDYLAIQNVEKTKVQSEKIKELEEQIKLLRTEIGLKDGLYKRKKKLDELGKKIG